jgi:hypothetical protein
MRTLRAAMTSVSTTWAASDFSGMTRAFRLSATVLATALIVGLAAFVAVAMGLT